MSWCIARRLKVPSSLCSDHQCADLSTPRKDAPDVKQGTGIGALGYSRSNLANHSAIVKVSIIDASSLHNVRYVTATAKRLSKNMAALPFILAVPILTWFKLVNDSVTEPYLVRRRLPR